MPVTLHAQLVASGFEEATAACLMEFLEKVQKLAAVFHEFIVCLLSERLAATTQTLDAVLR